MYRKIFISSLCLVVASCSPKVVEPDESIESLNGEELLDRVARDLEAVESTKPDSVIETAVAIGRLDSVREMNRRMDEVDRLAAEIRKREAAENAERARILTERIERDSREEQERIVRETSERLRIETEKSRARQEEDIRLLEQLR